MQKKGLKSTGPDKSKRYLHVLPDRIPGGLPPTSELG